MRRLTVGLAGLTMLLTGCSSDIDAMNPRSGPTAAASDTASPTKRKAEHSPADYAANAELLCEVLHNATPDDTLHYPIVGDYMNTKVPKNARPGSYSDCWLYTGHVIFSTSASGGSIISFEYVQLRAQIGGDHKGMDAEQFFANYVEKQKPICKHGGDIRSGEMNGESWMEFQCLDQNGGNVMMRAIHSHGVEYIVALERAQTSGTFTLDDFDPVADAILTAILEDV